MLWELAWPSGKAAGWKSGDIGFIPHFGSPFSSKFVVYHSISDFTDAVHLHNTVTLTLSCDFTHPNDWTFR